MKVRSAYSLLLLVPVSLFLQGCHKNSEVSNLVSAGGETYFELRDELGLHKVYTRETPGYSLLIVLDESNVPDVVALIDSKGERAVVTEYRREQATPTAGLLLLDTTHMSHVRSDDGRFVQWRNKFSLFIVSSNGRNKSLRFAKAAVRPMSIKVAENQIIATPPQINCDLDVLSPAGYSCAHSQACSCFYHHLCNALNCVATGDTQCVNDEMSKARGCFPSLSIEAREGGGSIKAEDLIVAKTNGVYSLSY